MVRRALSASSSTSSLEMRSSPPASPPPSLASLKASPVCVSSPLLQRAALPPPLQSSPSFGSLLLDLDVMCENYPLPTTPVLSRDQCDLLGVAGVVCYLAERRNARGAEESATSSPMVVVLARVLAASLIRLLTRRRLPTEARLDG